MRSSDFIAGLIIGGLLGAAGALLYTPASGKNLRIQVQTYANKVQDEIKQAAQTRRIELEQELATLRTPKTTNTTD